MVRIYDADDPDADLPLTQGETDAEQEADRIRDIRRLARREALGTLGVIGGPGALDPHPIHAISTPNEDAGTGPGTGPGTGTPGVGA